MSKKKLSIKYAPQIKWNEIKCQKICSNSCTKIMCQRFAIHLHLLQFFQQSIKFSVHFAIRRNFFNKNFLVYIMYKKSYVRFHCEGLVLHLAVVRMAAVQDPIFDVGTFLRTFGFEGRFDFHRNLSPIWATTTAKQNYSRYSCLQHFTCSKYSAPLGFSEGLSLLPPEKVRGACDRFLVPSADQGNVRDGPVCVERWHLLLEHLPDHGLAADPVENGRERGDVALRPLLEQLPQSTLLWVAPKSDQERVHLTRC